MPCRKCRPCLKMRRIEWSNRMKLEQFGKPYVPLFTTWTFRPEDYANSEKAARMDLQLFWKRLRKRGHDIRYFTVVERGEHNNRIHGHSILWSQTLAELPQIAYKRLLHDVWGKGIVDAQKLRSSSGFGYLTKYMVKDLSKEGQRNYQWSMKLGEPGIEYWKKSLYHAYEEGVKFSLDNLPPNKMLVPLMGKLEDVYIPKDTYVAFCKLLGVDFTEGKITHEEVTSQYYQKNDNILITDGTSKPYIQQEQEEYKRLSQAIFR